jgi:hypothetical protein
MRLSNASKTARLSKSGGSKVNLTCREEVLDLLSEVLQSSLKPPPRMMSEVVT